MTNKNIEKEIGLLCEKIPKGVIKMYEVEIDLEGVTIYEPAYIDINFDSKFSININYNTIDIENSKVSITLWENMRIMHVTVF